MHTGVIGVDRVRYLYRARGRGADEGRGAHGRGCGQAALPLVLVDPVSLRFRQLQEVLHRSQVDQEGLRRRLGVFLFPENLWEKTLEEPDRNKCIILLEKEQSVQEQQLKHPLHSIAIDPSLSSAHLSHSTSRTERPSGRNWRFLLKVFFSRICSCSANNLMELMT